jgi:hypothetical protein
VTARGSDLASPRLGRLARRGRQPAVVPDAEKCEMCGCAVPAEHRHLIDLESRELLCVCRACALLFDRPAAGGEHFRLIGDRRLRLPGVVLDDVVWEQLRIPVEMAFFFTSSREGRVRAFYPSPMGATESLLELRTWEVVERANPVLSTMEPDVEALLVNRSRGARAHWLVPIEDCYRLVALIRTRWRGFTGGREVWLEMERFFEHLDRQSRSGGRTPISGAPNPTSAAGSREQRD